MPSDNVEIYKSYVDSALRVTQWRLQQNNFYFGLNVAYISFLAAFATQIEKISTNHTTIAMLSLLGAALAVTIFNIIWIRQIFAYRILNTRKFDIIAELEKSLSLSPFTEEWRAKSRGRPNQLTILEFFLPIMFIVLNGGLIFMI